MLNDATRSQILAEFDAHRSTLLDLTNVLSTLVSTILQNSGYVVHSVTSRCKTRESLAEKLSRQDKSYVCLSDITDLIGLRITTYFADDIDRIAALLTDEFLIDARNSVDKRQALDPDQFGYQSLHYVAELSSQRGSLAEYRRFASLKFEIQLRSILQHAWAEIEHDIGYKSGVGVPREIRRRFSRIAGLLELADAEFLSIRDELAEYAERVKRDIVSATQHVELNIPSLRALYTFESQLASLDSMVAEVADSQLYGTGDSVDEKDLQRLQKLGILDVETLEQTAARECTTVKLFAAYWLKGSTYEKLTIGIGLFYLTYVLLWRTRDEALVTEYFSSNNIGDEPNLDAKRLLEFSPNAT